MPSQWSLQDAKNQFNAVVDAASQGTPQFVSCHGRPAVVVLSAEKYEEMLRQERFNTLDFAHFLLSMPSADDTAKDDHSMGGLCMREVDF